MRIDNVTIVDPRVGGVTPGMSILIDGGTILAVGPTAEFASAAEQPASVLDGAGRFAVPGFNNMHTHALQESDPRLALATMIAEGVTGFRQMEGSPRLLRQRSRGELPLSERTPGVLQMPSDLILPFNARNVSQLRREIDRQVADGADFIKLIMTERDVYFAAVAYAHEKGLRLAGHLPPGVRFGEAVGSGYDSVEHLGTSVNVWIDCSSEADALWAQTDKSVPIPKALAAVPFAGEVFTLLLKDFLTGPASNTTSDAQLATLDRAFQTHSVDRVTALGQAIVTAATWQSPTLIGTRSKYYLDDPEYRTDPWLATMSERDRRKHLKNVDKFSALPAEDLAIYHRFYDLSVETVGRWHAQGVPMLLGTDGAGRGVANSMALEFRELSHAGISPLNILRMMTTAPADYLGRASAMGAVAGGYDADIVLLDRDPLATAENLTSVAYVVRGGALNSSAELNATVAGLLPR
jgi:hypothetical protein